jgi:hypothetical protein
MLWAIARRTLRFDSDPVGHTANPEIELPCDCFTEYTREFASGTISRRRMLRSLACSNSDTIGSLLRMQPHPLLKRASGC